MSFQKPKILGLFLALRKFDDINFGIFPKEEEDAA